MDKLAAFSRLAPVPLHLHVNAVRFCWALCALLALRGICADILRKKTTTAKRVTVVHSLRQCTTKARTDGSSWPANGDQQASRGLPSWPLGVGVVALPWPSPVPPTKVCAACCEAGKPHLFDQSWSHAAHEIHAGTFLWQSL